MATAASAPRDTGKPQPPKPPQLPSTPRTVSKQVFTDFASI